MLRTGLKIFTVLAAVVAIVLGYFYFFDRHKTVPDIYNVFHQSEIIVRINHPENLNAVLSSSECLSDVYNRDSSIFHALSFLNGAAVYKAFNKSYVVAIIEDSIHSPVFLIENHTVGQSAEILDWATSQFYRNFKWVEKFNKAGRYFALFKGEVAHIFITEMDGVVVWASNVEALTIAMREIKHHSGGGVENKILRTAGETSFANLIIRPQLLSIKFGSLLKTEMDAKEQLSDIMVFDVYVKDNQLSFSGLSIPSNGPESLALAKAKSRRFELPTVVPENSTMVYHLSFATLLDKFSEKVDFQNKVDWLKGWADDEVVFVQTPSETAFAIKVKGESIAKNAFDYYKSNLDKKALAEKYQFDKSTNFAFLKADFNWAKQLLPAACIASKSFNTAAIAGEFVVFSTDAEFGREICRNTILQQNLRTSYRFQEQSVYLSTSSNRMVYIQLNEKSLTDVFTASFVDYLSSTTIFDLFDVVAFQSSGSGQHIYNQMVLYRQNERLSKDNIRWKTKLENSASIKPLIVKNHVTGKSEIMVQDQNDMLYLINQKGRVLWRKKLDGAVLGDIVQVDKYKNGKLQYILGTVQKIYLIDRNGNDVERFPVAYPAHASAGLSVFDYEQNMNYRIFVPLVDKRILLYDIDANIVPGWDFKKSDAIVRNPVQHYRFQNKDYIVFADSLRHYFLNRKGEHRIKLNRLVGKAPNNPIYFDSKEALWVSTSIDGEVLYTNLVGEVQAKKIDTIGSKHYFLYADLTRNGRNDYIFVDGSLLRAYDHKLKPLFTYTFQHPISEPPAYYLFSRQTAGLGIVDKQAGKVFMFNSKGKQFAGYPYPGITPFSISMMTGVRGFNLIVGNFDGFLYNYYLK